MKENNKKKLKGAATLTLAAALLVTGSLAWQDVSQHKTNNFATKSVAHSMVLVEDFEPVETWTLGQEIKKEVSVRNGQDSDDTSRFVYTDGYVRLQLREFMGISDQAYTTHPNRLMIDTDGNFYRFETQTEAETQATALNIPVDRVVPVKGINDDQAFFYIETAAGDINGQYGKFLIISVDSTDIKSIVDGSVVADLDKDVKDKHNSVDGSNQEDSSIYTTHLWSEGYSNFTSTSNKFSEYAEWNLGNDVISLQQWKSTYQGKPVAKWIVDTADTTNGYVYWGQKLDHATNATAKSMTSNLLEKVTLIKQPGGHAEYRIHVNMEAVSIDDLSKWTDGNVEIIGSYKNSLELDTALKALQDVISRAEATDLAGMEADTVQKLNDSIQSGKDVLDASDSFLNEIKNATKAVEEALAGLKFNEKQRLEELVSTVSTDERNFTDKYFKNVEKMDATELALSGSQDVLADANSKDADYARAYKRLSDAYEEIKDGKGFAELYENVYIAGRVFQYIKTDETNKTAIVMSKALTKSDFATMGLSDLVANDGYEDEYAKVKFSSDLFKQDYAGSNLITIDNKFYETFIKDHSHVVLVRQIEAIQGERDNTTTWFERTDEPTIYNKTLGRNAFTLSISDLNESEYGNKVDIKKLNIVGNTWLRTKHRASSMVTNIRPGLDLDTVNTGASTQYMNYHAPSMLVDLPRKR